MSRIQVGLWPVALATALAAVASGCANPLAPILDSSSELVRQSAEAAGASGARVEEALVFGAEGRIPARVRLIEKEPLDRIVAEARAREVGSAFELARRFEEGAGLPQDVGCATWWYLAADEMEYRGTFNTTSGFPLARVAARRLADAHPEARAVRDDPDRAGSAAYDRCDEALDPTSLAAGGAGLAER